MDDNNYLMDFLERKREIPLIEEHFIFIYINWENCFLVISEVGVQKLFEVLS